MFLLTGGCGDGDSCPRCHVADYTASTYIGTALSLYQSKINSPIHLGFPAVKVIRAKRLGERAFDLRSCKSGATAPCLLQDNHTQLSAEVIRSNAMRVCVSLEGWRAGASKGQP